MKALNWSFSKLLLLTFAFISVVFFLSFKWVNNQWRYNIASDGKGYYVYLPAAFIYHDFSYQFTKYTEEKYYPGDVQPSVAQFPSGQKLNKYFVGEAVLLMPFFFVACFLSYLFQFPIDGYSFIFQASVSVAALFYALAGLYMLSKFLKHFIASDNIISLVLLLVFLGSNLLHYTWMEPSMSHVYSFFAISVFMAFSADFFKFKNKAKLLLLIAIFGIICLIRPVNALIIFTLPFIWMLLKIRSPFAIIIQSKMTVLLGFLLFGAILFLQLLLYKLQIGQWWTWAYANEGFNFSHPHFSELVFSFRKGWLVYTPIAFISIVSAIPMWRKNVVLLLAFLMPLVIIVYVASSWHDWAYGASYGCRPMTEYIGFVIIPLALSLQTIKNYLFKAILVFSTWCLLLLNCVQVYQINKHILLWDNMSFKAYKASFLKTSDGHVNMLEQIE